MINRCCWRALETWLHHEELRDLHQSYLLKPSHLDYHISIIYPLYLLAVTCTQLIYIESYSLPLHVLVLFLACVCICCASYLLNLRNQAYVSWFAHHVCVFCVEPIVSCLYLIWLFWDINGLFHFGVVICLHFTILKCVYVRNTT